MSYKSALPFLVFGARKCLNIHAIYPKKMNSTYKYIYKDIYYITYIYMYNCILYAYIYMNILYEGSIDWDTLCSDQK